MRIGIVTTSFPRDVDDPAGTFVLGHARWLRDAGHSVEVIAAGHGGEAVDGIDVERIAVGATLFYGGGAPESLESGLGRWFDAAAFSSALLPAIARRARQWDGVFAHWLAPCAIACAMAAPRTPLVGVAHSGDVHLLRRLHLIKPMGQLLRINGARLAFVSEQLRGLFVDRLAGKTKRVLAERSAVCAMGVDVARFGSLRSRRATTEPPTVLFLGRLVAVKGVPVLIEAIAGLDRPLRVCIAGAGPEQQHIAAVAAQRGVDIELVGEARGDARDSLLRRASLFVLPSTHVQGDRTEGAPVSVIEALAAGVPVIASAVGGLRELPGDVVHLVEAGDAGALAAAINRVLDDRTYTYKLIENGVKWADTRDWSKVGPNLMKLFHTAKTNSRHGA